MTRLAAALIFLCGPALAQPLSGPAHVIDGDTISIHGQRIRLWGIDAPELGQMCRRRIRLFAYNCGEHARTVLAKLSRNRIVTCEPRDRDRYGRTIAICFTENSVNSIKTDIGAAMVRRGWALDFKKYSAGRYAAEEAAARRERAGIHSGRFMMPAEFRKERR